MDTKRGKRALDSFIIEGTNKTVRAGDCVVLRSREFGSLAPSIAKVKEIEPLRNSYIVKVQLYYRPEDSQGGRMQFHGSKELFMSDRVSVHSALTIEGMCTVHSLKSYMKLESVGPHDYYCRFHYNADTGAFSPDLAFLCTGCAAFPSPAIGAQSD